MNAMPTPKPNANLNQKEISQMSPWDLNSQILYFC